jgi:hypothetical protein
MTTARINARLDEALASKLREHEQRTGASVTDILREALTRYLADESHTPSPYAALEAAGVIGCVTAPEGLSSSYKGELSRSLAKKHRR